MRIGKVRENIQKRSVMRQLNMGEDQGSPACMRVRMNPVMGWTLAARRAVYGVVNSLVASGAVPESAAMTVLMPEGTEEKQLKAFMKETGRLCQEEKISIEDVYAVVSPCVSTLTLSVAGTGICVPTADRTESESNDSGHPDGWQRGESDSLYLIMTGHAGREGAALIAINKEEQLKGRYPASFIDTAKHLYDNACMRRAADILRQCGTLRLHSVGEGGVFGALWEFAAAGKAGLSVNLKSVPIRQHTIEVCEYFDLNPYMLLSGGCLLAACPDGRKAVEQLRRCGIEASVIGKTTEGNDRLIHYDTESRFLEPPKTDEIYRVEHIW